MCKYHPRDGCLFDVAWFSRLVVLFASKTDTVHKYSLDELQSLMLRLHYIVYVAVLLVFFLAASVVQSCTKIESRTIRAMAYAMSSAVIGAQSVTFFKILSELVAVLADSSDRITRSAVVTSPFTYVVVIAAISTCVFWMYRLNDGLRRFDALLIIPLFQVLWVTISTIGGGSKCLGYISRAPCFVLTPTYSLLQGVPGVHTRNGPFVRAWT